QEQDQRLSPSATSFLLMSVKRNGSKEKRFPDRANPAIHRWRDFSTRHPCLVEKRCTSMCSALRVCELARRRWDLQKLKTTNHQPPTHRLGWLHQSSAGGTMKQGKRAGRMLLLCAAFVLSLAGALPAFAQGIEERLGQLMAEHDTVGLAVVVVRDNAVVYRQALGWKDREKQVPLQ